MKTAKKNGFSKFIAVVLAIFSIVMPTIGVYADEIIEPSGQAAGIQSGASYMIKNAASGKYLTLPGYFDVEYDGKNNVYQSSAKVNDQYSRAVTVTYGSGKYNLSPLLFQGIVTGGLKNDGSGNVVYGETATVEYNWAIEKVNATQYRIYSGGFALTSYGNANGSVDSSGTNVAGNIYLTTVDQDSSYQLWTFESVTVNPHMLKNSDITKKNLGTGAEWLFQLGSGEMAADSGININSVSFSNSGIVRAAIVGGKRVIVKLNDDASTPDDRSDDYTVMTFNLNTGVKRIAVVQDAGTGANDACLTLPFEAEKKLRVVTLDEGANSEYILTFKSMPNIKITNWQILSDTGVEFAKSSGIELKGENFAVVKFNDVGFAVVRATDISGAVYTLMLDVEEDSGEGYVYCAENSIILDTDFDFELGRNQYVMFRFSSRFYDLLSCENYSGESVDIVDYNEECLVLRTGDVFNKTRFLLNMGAVESDGTENVLYQLLITLSERVCNEIDGICYIGNIEAGKYLQIDNTDLNPNASGVKTEIHPLDPEEESQLWDIVYLHNGYYWILSKKTNLALGVNANDVATADSSVRQLDYDPTILTETNIQWKIEPVRVLNGTQQYKITNRATLEAGYNYIMCANGTGDGSDGVIDLYIGNNDSYLDEWSIEYETMLLPSATLEDMRLKEIFGFTLEDAALIKKVYDEVDNKFPNETNLQRAWKCARLLGGIVYGNESSGSKSEFKWKDVAGQVFTSTEKEYFMNILEYSEDQYDQLRIAIVNQHSDTSTPDFAHYQISLSARLAYQLDLDGLASNIGTFCSDEDVSYLAGWLGDATLLSDGTTSFGNDDYCADLDAENTFRYILRGYSSVNAISEYYGSFSDTINRATIFLNYISYDVVRDKVFYELIDADIITLMSLAALQGDIVTVNYYKNLLNDVNYHWDTIRDLYPDTYYFLTSLYNKFSNLEGYLIIC